MVLDKSINYLEFAASDLEQIKRFYQLVFDWTFTDYGPEYTAFKSANIEGGFYLSDLSSKSENGAALVVFYANSLTQMQSAIKDAGGLICRDIFGFPGGFRFHFCDPSGNEFAVWSQHDA